MPKAKLIFLLLIFLVSQFVIYCNKPNVIVFFSDDAGYNDFGFQENSDPEFRKVTPNLNQFVHEGVLCTHGYVTAPVCSPSRAGMLTGRYQEKFGHEMNLTNEHQSQGLGMPVEEKTIADHLKRYGYKTACFGKWHLGRQEQYHPNSRGFDYFYGCIAGSRSYFPYTSKKLKEKDYFLQENGTYLDESKMNYFTDSLGDATVEFIEQNKKNPFFIYLSFTAPHGPLEAKLNDYKSLSNISSEVIRGDNRRVYASLLKSMDENIGKVMAKIKTLGLDDNTLMVFANDNGGPYDMGTSNGMLRGYKSTLYEGGIRVPMAFRWSGHLDAGRVFEDPVITLDFLPTFLKLAGCSKLPSNLDGVDLMPYLLSKSPMPERSLFWRRYGPGKPIAMRKGPWKLVIPREVHSGKYAPYGAEGPELYYLPEDKRENTNLYGFFPEVTQLMEKELSEWEATTMAPLWETDESNGTKKVAKKGGSFSNKPKRIE